MDDEKIVAAYERGEAFAFRLFEKPADYVGITEDGLVNLLTGDLEGFAFSQEDAQQLGVALISAAEQARLQGEEEP